MKEIDVSELIKDYTDNGFGVTGLCEKYHVGKVKVRAWLKENGIPMKKRGGQPLDVEFMVPDYRIKKYEEHEGFHYEAVDEKTGFSTKDYMNQAGVLTTHIKKTYGIEIPTLYNRNMHYMKTGNYWWEQWFKIVEVRNKDVKKCPYCEWETTDIENKGGAFETHLMAKHNITKAEYLREHPEDREYFRLVNQTLDRQMETDENKFVACMICGKKLSRITDVHLKHHGLTKAEYINKFSLTGTTCSDLHKRMSRIATEINTNMTKDFSSQEEHELSEYIKSFGFSCYSDRKVLSGKELDILIPEKNIAIEFNGNLWHSEQFGKNAKYHVNKLEKCNEAGISLIQIFEDEYVNHKDIVLSKIKHVLGVEDSSRKIPGRKCQIVNIFKSDAECFLNANHIQGFTHSTVYLGAVFEGKLVAVMTFLNENDGKWNLNRFASLNGCICQGVASKMFKHFIREYDPVSVISFADRRWTLNRNSNLYTKLGFALDEVLKPDYKYYNKNVDRYKRFHKFGFRKQILHKKYGLPLSMTELEMTRKLGYTRIWDCGLFKYVWQRNNEDIISETVVEGDDNDASSS